MSKRRGDHCTTRDSSDTSRTSKRALTDSCLVCSAPLPPKRPAPPPPQLLPHKKHLHLVLNDWDRGYSIYRASEAAFTNTNPNNSNTNADPDEAPRPAASPPSLLVRVVAQHAHPQFFAAHGTKIIAMYPAESSPGIPAFDTATLSMTVCPSPESRGNLGTKPVYASTSGKLWAFVYPFVEVLGPEPGATEEPTWSWASNDESTPAPFDSFRVSGFAVHPDGRTVFVSSAYFNCTYTFDVESLEWTHVGDWALPFRGQAWYDHELDAWVGLCGIEVGAGHVCCSDVPAVPLPVKTTTAGEWASVAVPMPEWKLGVEVFFDERSDERHVGATLVYLDNSRFCLVESRMAKVGDFYSRVVRMTSFVLKYGKQGELRVAGRCTYASMDYQTPHEQVAFAPSLVTAAFWL